MPRGVLIQRDNYDAVPLRIAHGYGVTSPTSHLTDWENRTGTILAYVDSAGKVFGTGLDARSQLGTNFLTPVSSTDAATKGYVDSQFTALVTNLEITCWFDTAPVFGSTASASPAVPTLAVTAATSPFNSTDPDSALVAKTMSDGNLSWLYFRASVPAELDTTAIVTIEVVYLLGKAGTGSEGVEFRAAARGAADTEAALDEGANSSGPSSIKNVSAYANATIVNHAIGTLYAANTLVAGDLIHGTIARDARTGNANDTFASSVSVICVRLKGTRRKLT